jgi:hypothetical protein
MFLRNLWQEESTPNINKKTAKAENSRSGGILRSHKEKHNQALSVYRIVLLRVKSAPQPPRRKEHVSP